MTFFFGVLTGIVLSAVFLLLWTAWQEWRHPSTFKYDPHEQ